MQVRLFGCCSSYSRYEFYFNLCRTSSSWCIRKMEAPKSCCISRKTSVNGFSFRLFIRLLMTDSLYISINRKSHVKLNSARFSIERSRLKHFNDKTILLFWERISKQKAEVLRPFQVPFTICIHSLGSLLAFDRQHPNFYGSTKKRIPKKRPFKTICPLALLSFRRPCMTTKAVQ